MAKTQTVQKQKTVSQTKGKGKQKPAETTVAPSLFLFAALFDRLLAGDLGKFCQQFMANGLKFHRKEGHNSAWFASRIASLTLDGHKPLTLQEATEKYEGFRNGPNIPNAATWQRMAYAQMMVDLADRNRANPPKVEPAKVEPAKA